MELQTALETRYSCRAYAETEPTPEQIEAVLEAGRLAPTACNNQDVHVWVVRGKENLAKMDRCTKCRFNAPVVFILGFDEGHEVTHKGPSEKTTWSFGDVDTASVLVHMALKATDLGLATCWLGLFGEEELRREFDIPENYRIRALLDFGVASEKLAGRPSPLHKSRKPLKKTVTWV